MSTIVIVGGGIAGLVAAYTLKKQSPRVDLTLLETEPEPSADESSPASFREVPR